MSKKEILQKAKKKKEIILGEINKKGFLKTITDNLKNRKILPYQSNTEILRVDIVSYCNLSCYNCNRTIGGAPSSEFMDLGQIKKFVRESLNHKKHWKMIVLVGGEPTLHPQLFEIVKEIKKYKDWNPQCKIRIDSNGHGEKVEGILKQLPPWLEIRNSKKISNKQRHRSYNLAPIDFKKYQKARFSKGCRVTEKCGIGLNPRGFYPCGPGGAVDRVFGFDIGIKNLNEVTEKRVRRQRKTLCRYCGLYKEAKDNPRKQENSPSWEKAFREYKKKKPKTRKY